MIELWFYVNRESYNKTILDEDYSVVDEEYFRTISLFVCTKLHNVYELASRLF